MALHGPGRNRFEDHIEARNLVIWDGDLDLGTSVSICLEHGDGLVGREGCQHADTPACRWTQRVGAHDVVQSEQPVEGLARCDSRCPLDSEIDARNLRGAHGAVRMGLSESDSLTRKNEGEHEGLHRTFHCVLPASLISTALVGMTERS